MDDTYDSELVHAIDQQILNESEPFYEDGEFTVELPENPADRLSAVIVDDEKLDAVLSEYVDEIERELRRVFDIDD
jgi:flagellar basal body-associated protein FliL